MPHGPSPAYRCRPSPSDRVRADGLACASRPDGRPAALAEGIPDGRPASPVRARSRHGRLARVEFGSAGRPGATCTSAKTPCSRFEPPRRTDACARTSITSSPFMKSSRRRGGASPTASGTTSSAGRSRRRRCGGTARRSTPSRSGPACCATSQGSTAPRPCSGARSAPRCCSPLSARCRTCTRAAGRRSPKPRQRRGSR